MSRFRFSIGSLLAALTLLALDLAALVSRSMLGASVAYTVLVVLLALATTLAIVPGSRQRLFCAGFAVFGWCYWFTEFEVPAPSVPQQLWTTGISTGMPRPPDQPSTTSADRRGPGLLTRHLIPWAESLFPNPRVGAQVMAQLTSSGYFPGTIVAADGNQYQVQWVDGTQQRTPASLIWTDPAPTRLSCHSLLGGLFALLGAILATLLGRTPVPCHTTNAAR